MRARSVVVAFIVAVLVLGQAAVAMGDQWPRGSEGSEQQLQSAAVAEEHQGLTCLVTMVSNNTVEGGESSVHPNSLIARTNGSEFLWSTSQNSPGPEEVPNVVQTRSREMVLGEEITLSVIFGSSEVMSATASVVGYECPETEPPAPEPEPECGLWLTKSAFSIAEPGGKLMYRIEIGNDGDADCTGGGVRGEDSLSTNVEFVSMFVSENISKGYGGSGGYTVADHTIRWNAHTLNPGETGWVEVRVLIVEPLECGDFEVVNQARATAKELDNYKTWVVSNEVSTQVENECPVVEPEPEPPVVEPEPPSVEPKPEPPVVEPDIPFDDVPPTEPPIVEIVPVPEVPVELPFTGMSHGTYLGIAVALLMLGTLMLLNVERISEKLKRMTFRMPYEVQMTAFATDPGANNVNLYEVDWFTHEYDIRRIRSNWARGAPAHDRPDNRH